MLAFVTGAFLGGLAVLLLSTSPSEPDARAEATVANPFVGGTSAGELSEQTVPQEWIDGGESSADYRPASLNDPSRGTGTTSPPILRADGGRQLSAPHQWRLDLVIALALGACFLGGGMMVLTVRRADARLEARLHRFEQAMARGNSDWFADLDENLEGEWEEESR
jgi:hypothetical protein